MSSEIKSTTLQTNSLKDKTGTRTLASDSGSAWSWGANVPKGSVIEQFLLPCTGSSITVQSGTYTSQNVTTIQSLPTGTNNWDVLTGSSIDYTPPTGTQTVIYEFNFSSAFDDHDAISHFGLYLDNDSGTATEVTNYRTTIEGQGSLPVHRVVIRYPFIIGGSSNTAIGQVASWSSARTIQIKCNEFTANYQAKVHSTGHWNSGAGVFTCPVIGITALA